MIKSAEAIKVTLNAPNILSIETVLEVPTGVELKEWVDLFDCKGKGSQLREHEKLKSTDNVFSNAIPGDDTTIIPQKVEHSEPNSVF